MKRTTALVLAAALLACTMIVGRGAVSTQAANNGLELADAVAQAPAASGKPKPIYAKQIKNGTYKIEVASSSSMFRVVDAKLTVADEKMWAVVTLSGVGYQKLYMGTGQEALADTDDKCIYYVEDDKGMYTYKLPVVALDQDIKVAAWSIKNKVWYDRVLVFQSSLIPANMITGE